MKPDAPLYIIFNVGSGHGDPKLIQEAIEGELNAANRRHEVLAVDDASELPAVAQRAVELAKREDGAVVVAGGDGSINTVAQVVLPQDCPLGVIPQGTFNYFGRTHGLPLDAAEATRVLLDAEVTPVQAGLINEHVFLVNASLGLYPKLLEDREAFKQQFGRTRLVALWSTIATLLKEHRHLMLEMEHGGKTEILRTRTLFVGNNPLQMEQVGIPEGELLHEGHLTAITVRPVSRLVMLGLLVRGALGTLGEAKNVRSFAFKRATVRLRNPYRGRRVKVAADGETFWLQAPLVFQVAPQALLLLRPRGNAPPT